MVVDSVMKNGSVNSADDSVGSLPSNVYLISPARVTVDICTFANPS